MNECTVHVCIERLLHSKGPRAKEARGRGCKAEKTPGGDGKGEKEEGGGREEAQAGSGRTKAVSR